MVIKFSLVIEQWKNKEVKVHQEASGKWGKNSLSKT